MPLDNNDERLKRGGRKGYEYEQAQLEKMRKILTRDLNLMDRLHDKIDKGELLTEQEEKIMQITSTRVNKIYDKLHASKESVEHSGEISLPQPILNGITKKDVSTDQSIRQDTELKETT